MNKQLCMNRFTGHPDFRHLPQNLCELHIANNYFEGHVVLDSLPSSLNLLYLSWNMELEGKLVVGGNLEYLRYDVRGTKISVSDGILWNDEGKWK